MSKAILQLEPLTCPSCAIKIESAVKSLPGIEPSSVTVLFNASKVKVDFDATKTSADVIEKTISTLGYDVIKTTVKD